MAGFNYTYAYHRYRMEEEFEKMVVIGKKAGMSDQQIAEMHRILLDELNNDRRFAMHTLSFDREEGERQLPLLDYIISKSSSMQNEIDDLGCCSWIESIATPEIYLWLKSLNNTDIQLLTLLVVDEMNQSEAAKVLGKHNSDISRRIKRLRKSLEKVLPEHIKREYIK